MQVVYDKNSTLAYKSETKHVRVDSNDFKIYRMKVHLWKKLCIKKHFTKVQLSLYEAVTRSLSRAMYPI